MADGKEESKPVDDVTASEGPLTGQSRDGSPFWVALIAESKVAMEAEARFQEEVRRLTMRAVSAAPPEGLVAAHRLVELALRLERDQIARARFRGISGAAIARLLGISRQALHQRMASRLERADRRRRREAALAERAERAERSPATEGADASGP